MDLSDIADELMKIDKDQYGLNKILLNLILQIFLKNNVDDPNDIVITIAEYLDLNSNSSLIIALAHQLNIMWNGNNWVWMEC